MTDDLQPERRGSFWKTVPGVLTAIAGLITAVVGLVALMVQIGSAATDPGAQGTVEVTTHPPTSDRQLRARRPRSRRHHRGRP